MSLRSTLSKIAHKAREILKVVKSPLSEEEADELILEPVKEFLESYIGAFIVDFESFSKADAILEESIKSKMIVGVELDGQAILLNLSKANGKPGGILRLFPTNGGQFTERISADEPTWASKYRITFRGNDALEYIDGNDAGKISYSATN